MGTAARSEPTAAGLTSPSNAIKYSPDGGTIELGMCLRPSNPCIASAGSTAVTWIPGRNAFRPRPVPITVPAKTVADCFKYRNKALPFMVAAGFIVAQMITMLLLGDWPVLEPFLVLIARSPSILIWGLGFAIGVLTSWAGWTAGKRRGMPVAAPQAA